MAFHPFFVIETKILNLQNLAVFGMDLDLGLDWNVTTCAQKF